MQLNKNHREEFVRRVMADVPKIDYETQAEDIVRKELVKLRAAAGLADVDNERLEIRGVRVVYWEDKTTNTFSVDRPNVYCEKREQFNFVSQAQRGVTCEECRALEKHKGVVELRDKHIAQLNERAALAKRVGAVIDSCSTLKQAKEALPEFAKYMPAEAPRANRSLPVVGNVVADLVSKGWPKK